MDFNYENSTQIQDRILYCDCLRIMATFAVIILHISAQCKEIFIFGSVSWYMTNIWGNLVRGAVPVFFYD